MVNCVGNFCGAPGNGFIMSGSRKTLYIFLGLLIIQLIIVIWQGEILRKDIDTVAIYSAVFLAVYLFETVTRLRK